jgi:putative membrane protein
MRKLKAILLLAYALLSAWALLAIYLKWKYPVYLTPVSTLVGFMFVLLHAGGSLGWRRSILLLALSTGISLAMESIGVATGLVYGPYHYTDRLGPLFLGLVPYLIPVAWFLMMYPSLVIASKLIGSPSGIGKMLLVAAVGGVVMTSWDLVMDPAMVLGGHWVWDGPQASRVYFGIPLQNFWGWWLTTFLVFITYLFITRNWHKVINPNPDRQAAVMYALTGGSSVLSAFLMGLIYPALIGLLAMLPWAVAGLLPTRDVQSGKRLKTTWF